MAGVRAQVTWSVDPKPILDVAGLTTAGALNFEVAGGATRLSNGGLLIADRGASSIKLIDASGKLIATSGRKGTGPGEFRIIGAATRCGSDTLLVWDPQFRQVSMVGSNGVVARQFRIPSDNNPVRALYLACTSSGQIAFLSQPTNRQPTSKPGVVATKASIGIADRDGKVISRVDSIASGEWLAVRNAEFPRPLGATISFTTAGEGIAFGVSDSARVSMMDLDGHRSSLGIPATGRAPSQQDMENAIQATVLMAPPQARPQFITGLMAVAPMPETVPLFSNLFGDTEGLLWVQSSLAGNKPTLIVVRPDGRLVARVQLPLALTIWEIGRDYILGAYSDANDEQHVAVFHLNRK